MSDIAISARNLSKCYRVYDNQRSRLLNAVLPSYTRGAQEVWALRDVSFDVRRGEALGIIGRNGGGKSTLLEILSGTLTPTAGDVRVSGRISALLELGSGFNPEYSGRDNVMLNGLLLGLSRDEILARFGEVEAFAEIGAAIDRPVKTYSSGMMMRLAFAVQVLCNPDILIVDEALSVGDFFFQQKCFAWLRKMRDEGLTLLFVSHDMGTVRNLCSTAVYLIRGEMAYWGDSHLAINAYLAEERTDGLPTPDTAQPDAERPVRAAKPAQVRRDAFWTRDPAPAADAGGDALLAIYLTSSAGQPPTIVRMGQRLTVEVECSIARRSTRQVSLVVKNRFDQIVTCSGTYQLGIPLVTGDTDIQRTVRFDVDCAIEAGLYSIKVTLGEVTVPNQGRMLDDSGWLGPITVEWDYDNDPAPFLGMFGLPIKASTDGAESRGDAFVAARTDSAGLTAKVMQ